MNSISMDNESGSVYINRSTTTNVYVRVDSSLQIGSGHVMRCLTLAADLRQRGSMVTFICRQLPGHLISLIEGMGFKVVRLPQYEIGYDTQPDDVAHAAWLGVSWEQDAAETVAALEHCKPDWLVVDNYAIDRRWEEAVRSRVGKIMVIDDLADRPHDGDLLLDQNPYRGMETRYDHLVSTSCRKLLGARYALLRDEFAVARGKLRRRDGTVRRVLVFFGGVDATNETEKVLIALDGISGRHFEVDVVVGSGNQQGEEIARFCSARDGFHYHCQVDNMAELMAAADLAIGAGGTTMLERCAMGVPSIVTPVASNQEALCRDLSDACIIVSVDSRDNYYPEVIADVIGNKEELNRLEMKSSCLVDCLGAKRVVDALLG